MHIVIKTFFGTNLHFDIEPTTRIEDLKDMIKCKTCTNKNAEFQLKYGRHILDDNDTLQTYSIQKDSYIYQVGLMKGGNCSADNPSELVDSNNEEIYDPLESNKLNLNFIRNLNSTGVYEQKGGTCYGYAATSAYINTILRVYGHSKEPPSFSECLKIACYNGDKGGIPSESIRRLEEHFHYGILCDEVQNVSIRDTITISVIASFSTSKVGWKNVSEGSLLKYPGGEEDGWHASLVDGYDFEKDCFVCKNSWGGRTASLRFDFTESAAHEVYFTRVFFTLDSIRGKTNKVFSPKILKRKFTLNGQTINGALLDETAATYSSEYVCEPNKNGPGIYKYIGYDVYEWIKVNLNRKTGSLYSKYHYENQKLKSSNAKQ